ncbi:TPA: hypothetical protein ACQZFW_005728, partial [Escherichia coli]
PAQILPSQRWAIEVQRVEIRGRGIPVLAAAVSHGETSLFLGTSPQFRCAGAIESPSSGHQTRVTL